MRRCGASPVYRWRVSFLPHSLELANPGWCGLIGASEETLTHATQRTVVMEITQSYLAEWPVYSLLLLCLPFRFPVWANGTLPPCLIKLQIWPSSVWGLFFHPPIAVNAFIVMVLFYFRLIYIFLSFYFYCMLLCSKILAMMWKCFIQSIVRTFFGRLYQMYIYFALRPSWKCLKVLKCAKV